MFVISSNNSFPTAILDGLKSIGLRPISESPVSLFAGVCREICNGTAGDKKSDEVATND
jgi:hypothetical protein